MRNSFLIQGIKTNFGQPTTQKNLLWAKTLNAQMREIKYGRKSMFVRAEKRHALKVLRTRVRESGYQDGDHFNLLFQYCKSRPTAFFC